jgi:hypothetical protein
LLAYGRWFSPVSSTTKTGCHDIAEILLKVALNAKNHHHQSSSMYKEIQYMNHIYQCKKFQYNQLSTGIVLYRTGATSGTGTAFCNLQSRARTYAVLVIGLYELLGNPTI